MNASTKMLHKEPLLDLAAWAETDISADGVHEPDARLSIVGLNGPYLTGQQLIRLSWHINVWKGGVEGDPLHWNYSFKTRHLSFTGGSQH